MRTGDRLESSTANANRSELGTAKARRCCRLFSVAIVDARPKSAHELEAEEADDGEAEERPGGGLEEPADEDGFFRKAGLGEDDGPVVRRRIEDLEVFGEIAAAFERAHLEGGRSEPRGREEQREEEKARHR